MRDILSVLIAGLLLAAGSLRAQGPPPPPLSEKELVKVLKSKEQRAQAVAMIEQRGVSFELDPEIEKKLRKAKASEEVIEAVKQGTPSARAQRAAATGSIVASPEEERDMLAVQNELNPDVAIQLAADFEKKYPESPLLPYVLAMSAAQYAQKNDIEHLLALCEKSLKLKDDNLMALLLIAQNLPQPQSLRLGNTEQRLDRAEKYAKLALEIIGTLTARPDESPDNFAKRKSYYLQDMHSALGMVHLQRALQSLGDPDPGELTKAEGEYELAVTVTSDPRPTDYYRLGEVRQHMKKIDAAIEAFTHSVELDNGSGIKAYAEERLAALKKVKGQAPAKP